MLFVRDRFDVQHLPLFERKINKEIKKKGSSFFFSWMDKCGKPPRRTEPGREREMGGSKRKGRDSGLSVRKSNLTLASRSRIDSLLY